MSALLISEECRAGVDISQENSSSEAVLSRVVCTDTYSSSSWPIVCVEAGDGSAAVTVGSQSQGKEASVS